MASAGRCARRPRGRGLGALALVVAACSGKPAARPHRDGGGAGATGRGLDGAVADPGPVTPDGAAPPYRLAALGAGAVVAGAGTIAVTVTWADAPAAMRASPGVTACARPRPPRATIGALHGVAGVVVVVDGIAAGKRPPPATPVRLTVRDCALTPAVAVVPRLGASLEVQAQDDAGHAIAITELGLPWAAVAGAQPAVVTRARLPAWGHTVALALPAAGLFEVVADGAADAAYVVVTDQPYAAVTGDDGAVALEQVPAGTHSIVAWLPPAAGQAPRVARGQATVVAGDQVELTLRLGS